MVSKLDIKVSVAIIDGVLALEMDPRARVLCESARDMAEHGQFHLALWDAYRAHYIDKTTYAVLAEAFLLCRIDRSYDETSRAAKMAEGKILAAMKLWSQGDKMKAILKADRGADLDRYWEPMPVFFQRQLVFGTAETMRGMESVFARRGCGIMVN